MVDNTSSTGTHINNKIEKNNGVNFGVNVHDVEKREREIYNKGGNSEEVEEEEWERFPLFSEFNREREREMEREMVEMEERGRGGAIIHHEGEEENNNYKKVKSTTWEEIREKYKKGQRI